MSISHFIYQLLRPWCLIKQLWLQKTSECVTDALLCCLWVQFLGECGLAKHKKLKRNSWFQRVLTSSPISGSKKLELWGPRGVRSNSKPRLMTPPEGHVSHSESFLSSNLHTSLPSIWHSDSRVGSYGCDITPNLWHHHCPSVISHGFAKAADKIRCLLAGMTGLFTSWLEEADTHFLKSPATHRSSGGH